MDRAGLQRIEQGQGAQQQGLARPRGRHQPQALAGSQLQIQLAPEESIPQLALEPLGAQEQGAVHQGGVTRQDSL